MSGAGRPTKYKPEYCEQVIPFMSQGYSTKAFAGHIGVSLATVYNWMESEPEFLEAIKGGQAASALWWEETLRNNAKTGEGSAASAIFGVKNRSQEEWKDKHEVDHSNSDGSLKPVDQITISVIDAATDQSD